MKTKLLQLLDFLKTAAIYSFKIALRVIKVIVEESIVVLQKLDTLLTNNVA